MSALGHKQSLKDYHANGCFRADSGRLERVLNWSKYRTSAFANSGHSIRVDTAILNGSFRPIADARTNERKLFGQAIDKKLLYSNFLGGPDFSP